VTGEGCHQVGAARHVGPGNDPGAPVEVMAAVELGAKTVFNLWCHSRSQPEWSYWISDDYSSVVKFQ
jgi:hypothetical protein